MDDKEVAETMDKENTTSLMVSIAYLLVGAILIANYGWLGVLLMLGITIALAIWVLSKNWWLVEYFRDMTAKNVEKATKTEKPRKGGQNNG